MIKWLVFLVLLSTSCERREYILVERCDYIQLEYEPWDPSQGVSECQYKLTQRALRQRFIDEHIACLEGDPRRRINYVYPDFDERMESCQRETERLRKIVEGEHNK